MFQEQHHNEPFDDDADLFNEDVLFQENSTSEEDGNDEEVCYNIDKIETQQIQSNCYIIVSYNFPLDNNCNITRVYDIFILLSGTL
jgi:hypothetical protein